MIFKTINKTSFAKSCPISRFILSIAIPLVTVLVNDVAADPAPVNYPGVINSLNLNGVRGKRELIGGAVPSISFADQGWFARFLLNLIGYSIILFPCALIVFMVKNKLCLPQGK